MIFLAYEIVREDQDRGAQFYCHAPSWEQIDRGAIERESERVRDGFDNTYSGGHVVIRHWESKPAVEKYVRNRKESFDYRDLTFAKILDGSDNKTKRWLEAYLAHKSAKQQPQGPREHALKTVRQRDPLTVGQVLQDDIPF